MTSSIRLLVLSRSCSILSYESFRAKFSRFVIVRPKSNQVFRRHHSGSRVIRGCSTGRAPIDGAFTFVSPIPVCFLWAWNFLHSDNVRVGGGTSPSIQVFGCGPNVIRHRRRMGSDIKPVAAPQIVTDAECVQRGQRAMNKRG